MSFPSRSIRVLLTLIASSFLPSIGGAQSKPTAPSITHENVAYGDHSSQIMDFYAADVEGPAPAVIYIHGGGFRNGSTKFPRRR